MKHLQADKGLLGLVGSFLPAFFFGSRLQLFFSSDVAMAFDLSFDGLGYFSQFGCRTPKSGAPQRDNHLNRPHHDHGRIPTSAQYYRPPAHHLMQNNVYIHVIFLYCLYCDIYRRSLLIPRHTFSCSSRLMAMFDYGRTRQQMKAGCRRQLFEHIGFEIPAICL